MSPRQLPKSRQRRSPSRSIRVWVEGNTEEQYVNYWGRLHRDSVLVSVGGSGLHPTTLVDNAISELSDFTEVWCVFDDDGRDLRRPLALANGTGVNVALSVPCIELWLILHYKAQTAFLDHHSAQRAAKELTGCGKNLTAQALDALAGKYDQAKARAQTLDHKHRRDGTQPPANPSSGLWRLIDSIRR